MNSPISIGPDSDRTGFALKFRWRKATYTVFIGFAARTQTTTIALPWYPQPDKKKAPVVKSLHQSVVPGEPDQPDPEEPTGDSVLPGEQPNKPKPPATMETKETTYRLEAGISRTVDSTTGGTDSSGDE
jgi:hypothetical protein